MRFSFGRQLMAVCAALFFVSSAVSARAAKITAFTGATIHTAAGQTLKTGTLIIKDGSILEVGPADQVTVPDDAERIDVTGKTIIPGLVDSHSHLGVYSR